MLNIPNNTKPFSFFFLAALFFFFSGCASLSKGFLAGGLPADPLDPGVLRHHCDLRDPAACLLLDGSEPENLSRLPIIQGGAPSDKALFAMVTEKSSGIRAYLLDRSKRTLRPLDELSRASHSQLPEEVIHLGAKDLSPGTTYGLLILDDSGGLLDYRSFQTQKSAQGNKLRFALVSCTDDRFKEEEGPMWRQLLSDGPDIIISLGDNVYADWKEGKALSPYAREIDLWERYFQTRKSLSVFRSPGLVPFIAVWDDHDYGMNDGDGTYPHKEPARKVFEAFFPFWADGKDLRDGPGVARAFRIAGQNFLLMDGRTFRSPNGNSPACSGKNHPLCQDEKSTNKGNREPPAHFGRVQEEWALEQLSAGDGPFWLMNGVQWFGAYQPFESFEGNHPKVFSQFLAQLTKVLEKKPMGSRSALVFASGDRHLAEIMKVRLPWRSRDTWEITSSGLHARTFPSSWADFPNPRQIEGVSGQLNYTIVSSEKRPNGSVALEAVSKGPGGAIQYKRSALIDP
jgi:alkaline phosphatase D